MQYLNRVKEMVDLLEMQIAKDQHIEAQRTLAEIYSAIFHHEVDVLRDRNVLLNDKNTLLKALKVGHITQEQLASLGKPSPAMMAAEAERVGR